MFLILSEGRTAAFACASKDNVLRDLGEEGDAERKDMEAYAIQLAFFLINEALVGRC